MKFSSGTAGILALGLAAAPIACIVTGCASSGVAATVNGVNIDEQTITDYIQNYRESNDLMDEQKWAQYLVDNNLTPETLRQQTIDFYVQQEVIKQAAKEQGIEVTDEEVDNQLVTIKEYYSYDDDQLAEAVKGLGYNTFDDYKEYVRQAMMQERLLDQNVEGQTPSDDEIMQSAASYASILNGSKKLENILLNPEDTEKAADLKKQIDEGADFAALASENSVSTDYDGWDVLVTQDQTVSETVKNMNVGDVSDVIQGSDNWLFITKVVDVCNVDPEAGFTSIDQIPADIKDQIAESLKQSSAQSEFSTYVDGLVEAADVKINDMPKGLPYDVSLEGVTSSNELTAQDGADVNAVADATDVSATEGTGEGEPVEVSAEEVTAEGTNISDGDTINVSEEGVTVVEGEPTEQPQG